MLLLLLLSTTALPSNLRLPRPWTCHRTHFDESTTIFELMTELRCVEAYSITHHVRSRSSPYLGIPLMPSWLWKINFKVRRPALKPGFFISSLLPSQLIPEESILVVVENVNSARSSAASIQVPRWQRTQYFQRPPRWPPRKISTSEGDQAKQEILRVRVSGWR